MIVFYNFNEELFLSTPSARRATFSKYLWGCCVEFLSTPSARRATSRLRPCLRWYSFLSTPSARRATTTAFRTTTTPRNSFLSTPSARRATYIDAHLDDEVQFLSTPSARRATIISSIIVLPLSISIHALREEGDIVHGIGESLSFISIHALREEGDFARAGQRQRAKKFLSTPSARRATSTLSTEFDRKSYFYPRPPRGGRHGKPRPWKKHHTISIHALREEGDLRSATVLASHSPFLSTPSARRATSCPKDGRLATCISIHALREEGDSRMMGW